MTHSTDHTILRDAAGQIDYARYRRLAEKVRTEEMDRLFQTLARALRVLWQGSSASRRHRVRGERWA